MEGKMSLRKYQVLEEEKYVPRLKEHMPEKFREMCYMHLSFILNLSDDKLEKLLSEEDKSSTRRMLALVNPIFKKKEKNAGSLFGAVLTLESIRLMAPLMELLASKEMQCKEGLFRKPGNRQRMRTLREALNEAGPGFTVDTSVYNAHDVCGVLKEFLRELPEPLLTDKHMDAHMQIAGLGNHAETPEEIARYNHKKISALQLLMQLLPTATNRMMEAVLSLLHDISVVPETKMTPDTLATIFAPIFFLNKKVSPLDMCDVIKVVEPALAFMIANAHKMFQVPRELAVDIKNYCKTIEGCDEEEAQVDPAKVSQAYKIRKSISGRTLNTAVCYIDREQAKAQDSASITQNELENLFAHINSLPDTPSNRRYKEMLSKTNGTPVSSGKNHSRSKSIGASLKKHLPSLSKTKTKSFDTSSDGSSTPYRDIARHGVEHHRVNMDSNVMVVNCLAAKERRPRSLQPVDYEKSSTSGDASMMELLQSSGLRLSETTKAIADSVLMFSSTPPLNFDRSPFQRRKRRSSEDDAAYLECTPTKQGCRDQSVNKRSSTASATSKKPAISLRLPLSTIHNDSPKIDSVNHVLQKKEKSSEVATPQEIKDKVTNAPVAVVPGLENEITYLPFQQAHKNSVVMTSDNSTPVQNVSSRRPLRPCNAPGTPVMPRTLLQMARTFSMETSI